MDERNIVFRRKADLINLVAAILLTFLQTYQASQARQIQERLDDIEQKQQVILRRTENVSIE